MTFPLGSSGSSRIEMIILLHETGTYLKEKIVCKGSRILAIAFIDLICKSHILNIIQMIQFYTLCSLALQSTEPSLKGQLPEFSS